MAEADAKLRFAVGARVSCNMGREGWASGQVVALRYREAMPDYTWSCLRDAGSVSSPGALAERKNRAIPGPSPVWRTWFAVVTPRSTEVMLDPSFGGALIYAPTDQPRVIRAEMPSTFSIPEAEE